MGCSTSATVQAVGPGIGRDKQTPTATATTKAAAPSITLPPGEGTGSPSITATALPGTQQTLDLPNALPSGGGGNRRDSGGNAAAAACQITARRQSGGVSGVQQHKPNMQELGRAPTWSGHGQRSLAPLQRSGSGLIRPRAAIRESGNSFFRPSTLKTFGSMASVRLPPLQASSSIDEGSNLSLGSTVAPLGGAAAAAAARAGAGGGAGAGAGGVLSLDPSRRDLATAQLCTPQSAQAQQLLRVPVLLQGGSPDSKADWTMWHPRFNSFSVTQSRTATVTESRQWLVALAQQVTPANAEGMGSVNSLAESTAIGSSRRIGSMHSASSMKSKKSSMRSSGSGSASTKAQSPLLVLPPEASSLSGSARSNRSHRGDLHIDANATMSPSSCNSPVLSTRTPPRWSGRRSDSARSIDGAGAVWTYQTAEPTPYASAKSWNSAGSSTAADTSLTASVLAGRPVGASVGIASVLGKEPFVSSSDDSLSSDGSPHAPRRTSSVTANGSATAVTVVGGSAWSPRGSCCTARPSTGGTSEPLGVSGSEAHVAAVAS